jgi:3-hydroxyisobutyrate dehydrogenase-like beta-hydroxyacid dehydrogenase
MARSPTAKCQEYFMTNKVMVIGLGSMGSAFAMTLLRNDYEVTVWNRTASRAAPLLSAGAIQAANVSEGVGANHLIVICVSNYEDTQLLLAACGDLSGKTIVQLTTASASEAKGMEAWAIRKGGSYLDGEILFGPSDVGTKEAMLIVAGSLEAWRAGEPVVKCLGGSSRYLGKNVTEPTAFNAAAILPMLGGIMGMIQGIQIIESENMDVGKCVDIIADLFESGDQLGVRRQGNAIARNEFSDSDESIEAWEGACSRLLKGYASQGVNVEILQLMCDLLGRAIKAGYGREDAAAVIKVMRDGTAPAI